ncbi:MAG: TIR domain-containing protein [Saprospiraceae bacterium]|nr:toll/interleukin-1 receptor domain-containing protein [Saprospiraceae bacterium]MDW8229448.1 TIR domain-containing protein [Saprospiraceae bacterium]
MLRVYISYDPADKDYLQTLLRWLRPLEQKYQLHVWHIPPALPTGEQPYYWDDMLNELEQAHLYLFLTSPNSQKSQHVQKEEIPRALKRQAKLGEHLVQLYRIPLPGANGGATLMRMRALGMAKQIDDWKSDLVGYEFLTKDLEKTICELERTWLEEKHRTGLVPASHFEAAAPTARGKLKPIPGWLSLSFALAIFYMVTSLYFRECAPRRYQGLPEDATVPYVPPPRPYSRENPITPPQPEPPRPE